MPNVVAQVVAVIAIEAVKAFAIKAAIAVALAAATNAYAKDQAKKNNNLPEKEAISRGTTQTKTISYGYTVKAGTLAYMNAVQTEHSGGVSQHELHMVVVVDAQKVDEIADLYLDGHAIMGGVDLNWSTNIVESGFFAYTGGTDLEAVKIWRHHGDQTARDAELASHYSGDISTSHVGHELAYFVIRFGYNRATLSIFENGQPQTIRVGMYGAKVYDPRLDSTVAGGSGSHRFATPATWEWSSNPILCAAHYKTQVMRTAGARMDWVHLMTQADICDVLVDVPVGATEARYHCNGSVSLGSTHGENMQAILDCCMGRPRWVGGKWSFYAGAYQAPDFTLTDADILADGDITVATALPREDTYNIVRAVYTGEDFGYHDTDAIEQRSPDFIDRDGGEEIVRTLRLPLVTSETLAQRIEWKTLQQSDMTTIVTLPLWFTGKKCVIGTVVNVTFAPFGWTNKIFRCINLKHHGDVPVEGVFRLESAGSWADPEESDYGTRDAAGVIVPGTYTVHPPLDLLAYPRRGGNLLLWTQPSDHAQNDYYRLYAATSNAFGTSLVVYEGAATAFFHDTDVTNWYWINSVRGNSDGDRYPAGSTSTITATPIAPNNESELYNPGFEFGLDKWDESAAGHFQVVEDAGAHNGARMLKVGAVSGIFGARLTSSSRVAVSPGKTITWGGYYKTDASFSGIVRLDLEYLDADLVSAGSSGAGEKLSWDSANTDWTRLAVESEVVPDGVAWVQFVVVQKTNSAAKYSYVDDVFILPYTPLNFLGKLPYEDTFDELELPRYLNLDMEILAGSTQMSILDVSAGTAPKQGGPFVLRIGDNSGNDTVTLAQRKNRTSMLSGKAGVGAAIFELSYHVRQKSGAGSMYLGLRCLAGDRLTELGESGGNAHYVAASGYVPGDTAWHTITGYFTTDRSTAADANAATGTWTLANPMKIHPDTRWVGPLYIPNYNAVAGEFEVSRISIRQVGTKSDGVINQYPPLQLTLGKPSTTTRTNNTLADDPYFAGYGLDAASLYRIKCTLLISAPATPDFQFKFNFSQAPTYCVANLSGTDCGAAQILTTLGDLQTNATVIPGGAGTAFVKVEAMVATHATLASTLALRWAQNTTDAAGSALLIHSTMEATKIL